MKIPITTPLRVDVKWLARIFDVVVAGHNCEFRGDSMTTLITGGTGFLGSQLAHLFAERGEDIILFDINPNLKLIEEIKDRVKVISGNLANWPEVLNAINASNVEGIFHLGSMLSVPSQDNPWASFQANVCGTMHVLEAARLFKAKRVVFTSSLATYALGIPRVVTDDTLQRLG